MTIYRGNGGGGNATTDSELNAISALTQVAAGHASSAADSAAAASTSASNAATSETNAATSATNASNSASAAATSASQASTSASQASTSASNAATSETNAAASAASIDPSTLVRTTDVIAVSKGGTGSTTASAARTALGVAYGPAFNAWQSTVQSLSTGVDTKLLFQSEDYDTENAFASSRYTVSVQGWYVFTASFAVATSATRMVISLFRNGTLARQLNRADATGHIAGSAMLYLNVGDYVEIYGNQNAAAQNTAANAALTYFQGYMLRP